MLGKSNILPLATAKKGKSDDITKKESKSDIDLELHNEAIYDSEAPTVEGKEYYDPDNEIVQKPAKGKEKTKKEGQSLRIGSSVPLSEVLSNSGVMKLFKQKQKIVINYFCLKLEELIQVCFSEENSDNSSKAYMVLASGEHKIVANIVKADKFQVLGSEITASDKPNLVHLGRFASIISSILDSYPDHLVDNCGFLPRLIRLCHIPCISKLFNKFCKNDPKLEKVQKYLVQFGFPMLVQRELEGYRHKPFEHDYDVYSSEDVYRAASLYRIIANSLLSKYLCGSFTTYDTLSLCEVEYDQIEHIIEDEKWIVVLALYNQGYGGQLLNFVYSAVMKMREAKDRFYPCHVHALKFLAYMIKTSDAAEDLLIATDFFAQLLRLLFIFYQSPFFQDAFSKFILSAVTKETICKMCVPLILPAIIGLIEDEKSLPFKACGCSILTQCQQMRSSYPFLDEEIGLLPDFGEFYDQHIILRNMLINLPYGEGSEDELQRLTKEVEIRDAAKLERKAELLASVM